jgi:uncharacterized protein
MNIKYTLLAGLMAAAVATSAQAQAPAASASAPVSAAKKALVAKVLQLQQPGIEAMARAMVEQPAAQLMQQVSMVLRSRVPADQREALARDIQADLKKYVDETTPSVRERAVRLAPSTIGAVLEQKLTEEELKQVIAILESPANRKFQALGGEMQRAISEKLVAESRSDVQPKIQAMEQSIGRRLGPFASPAASAPK